MLNINQVLKNEDFPKIRPLGMSCILISRTPLEGEEIEEIILLLEHTGAHKTCVLTISLPIFKGNVIKWRNSWKALLFEGQVLVDSEFDISIGAKPSTEHMDLHIVSPEELAIRGITRALAHALRTWFYSDQSIELDLVNIQAQIDFWIANGTEWRVLKYSDIAKEDQGNGLVIVNLTKAGTHIERMLHSLFNPRLWDLIDMNSTSFGDNPNGSFRLVDGTSIQNSKLIPSKTNSPFCGVLSKHAIGLGMNPRRAYLLRNTFEQVVDIIIPEDPIVSPYKDDEKVKLQGVNLLTALMHLKHHTHEDGIVISESAAKKMVSSRIITQLVESDLPVVPCVTPGDMVNPASIVALDGDRQVTATKLLVFSQVEVVSMSKGRRFGKDTNRCWIKYRSFYSLENGDKLSNRHGGKGVVTVIPDEEMPHDDQGNRIEVCIGPESVINRRSMSVFWEIMLCRKAQKEGLTKIKVSLLEQKDGSCDWPKDELHNFDKLAEEFGENTQLFIKEKPLPHTTFVGPMFWMRIDKIAMEIVSCVAKKRKKSAFGAVVDSANVSGQRCNVAKILALDARGVSQITEHIIAENISGQDMFKSFISAIQNKRMLI